MLKNKNIIFLTILMIFSMFLNISILPYSVAKAQEEEVVEDEEVIEDEEIDNTEEVAEETTEPAGQEEQTNEVIASQAAESAKFDNPGEDPLASLETIDVNKVDLFQMISDMERKNMLIKLQMEQEKLKLSLQRLQSEKDQMAAKLEAEQLKRDKEQREIAKKEAEEELERQRKYAELEKQKMIEERKQKLITKVAEAFAENPKQDYTGLLNMIKAENNNVVPKELKFIEDKMKAMIAEEKANKAKEAAESVVVDQKIALERALEVYSIIGIKGELIATVKNKLNAQSFKVKEGTHISNGFVVSSISPESVVFTKGDEVKTLYLNVR